jgi:membrane protein
VRLPAVAQRSLRRFVEIEGIDRAIVLAAQGFSALFPLLIVVSSTRLGRPPEGIADDLIDRFDLKGDAEAALLRAIPAPEETSGVTAISLIVLVLAATAFTRALQRLYERAWQLPARGMRDSGWGLAWLIVFCAYWSLAVALEGVPGLALALSCLLWLVTPYMLLARRLPWRRLVPQAVLSATGLGGVALWATLFMPSIVATTASQFGAVGVSFAMLTWTLVIGFTLVVAAVLGAAIVDPDGAPAALGDG